MTRERLIPLLFVAAIVLDYLFPVTAHAQKAWLLPALFGVKSLVDAIKGKRESKNSNAAEKYKAERQNAVDQYEAALSKAKRGERLRYANALAKTRGFAVPEFDPSASESTNLNLPAVPNLKDGGWLDVVGGLAGGVANGISTDARLNTERGSLPSVEEAGPPSSMIVGGGSPSPSASPSASVSPGDYASANNYTPFDPSAPSSASDPYGALLGSTRYFSNLRPR